MTRRTFLEGTAAVVAGAAVGIGSDKKIDTKLGMYFFGPEPLIFDARLGKDEFSDLLVMEVLHEKGHVVVHLPLASVKRAVATPATAAPAQVRIWKDGILGQRVEEDEIHIIVEKNMLTMRGPGDEAAPAWLPIEDVLKIVS